MKLLHTLPKLLPPMRPIASRVAAALPWRIWGLTLLAGLVMAAAMPPLGLWPLAWVALIPLWRSLLQPGQGNRARQQAWLWAAAFQGPTLIWITGLHPLTWMGLSWGTSVAIAWGCWLIITAWGLIQVRVWVWAVQRLPQHCGLRLVGGIGLWGLVDWLWQQSPLYWSPLALSQSPANTWLLPLAELSGAEGLTLLIVAVNGLLAWASLSRRRSLLAGAIALWCCAELAGWGLGQLRAADGSALTIGLIQGNVPTRIKTGPEGILLSRQRYRQGYQQLTAVGVDAVITPEGSDPTLWQAEQSPWARWLAPESPPLLLGTYLPQGDRYRQSLLALEPGGAIAGRYDKVRLVPLGEYIPGERWFGRWLQRLSPIQLGMQAGRLDQRFQTPVGQVAASICYELVFPDVLRSQVQRGATWILSAANLDPYSEQLMNQHLALAALRAAETDRWVVQVTNTGYSALINPLGQVQWRSQSRIFMTQAVRMAQRSSQTPYVRWGDSVIPILLASTVIWLGWRQRWPKQTL
ncbi:apolipoprotein N-acyltransferase [Synechococcus elongatus IITB7]|uniref:apolipoprotein N-acyltransferase n=1 Tax=Synechococcus elongatus TaxID=32046 RepID=UPI0030CE7626